jgi:hypothetical protein
LQIVEAEHPAQVSELLRGALDGPPPVVLWGAHPTSLWEPCLSHLTAASGQALHLAGLSSDASASGPRQNDLAVHLQALGCSLVLAELTDLSRAARLVRRFWSQRVLTPAVLLRALVHDLPNAEG